jgi:hypothetical protein
MANIKRNIRYYQPNDPYYWEVDNLPLADLLSNDVILQDRINSVETLIGGLGGGGDTGGTGNISLNAITDLKAWTEPLDGQTSNYGKIFVNAGKFIARMQLPATRESGWRMMRDESRYFNNENWYNKGTGMLNTTTLTDFVRGTHGVARTAVCEFYANANGSSKGVVLDDFDSEDFNGGVAPFERLDLIYLKGTKALDTDGDTPTTDPAFSQNHIPAVEIGVIKGAGFRTDAAGGTRTNGTRFTNPITRGKGRTTGMGQSDIPAQTNLPGFGTVPMPDDLANFAQHFTSTVAHSDFIEFQVETQAAFTLPIAYVRVPKGYTAGDPIPPGNIVDIRPFFRTTELTGSEREAIATSWQPHGGNPFVTEKHLDSEIGTFNIQVQTNKVNIANNRGRIEDLEAGGGGTGSGQRTEYFSTPRHGIGFRNRDLSSLWNAQGGGGHHEFFGSVPQNVAERCVSLELVIITTMNSAGTVEVYNNGDDVPPSSPTSYNPKHTAYFLPGLTTQPPQISYVTCPVVPVVGPGSGLWETWMLTTVRSVPDYTVEPDGNIEIRVVGYTYNV